MAVNKQLAQVLGISGDNIYRISAIHLELGDLLATCAEGYQPEVYQLIEEQEYVLQGLWGFPHNEHLHTWKHLYKFRCQWVGRKFKCLTTGETLEIPDNVYPKDYLSFGEAGVDVGVLGGYYRMINCKEVT